MLHWPNKCQRKYTHATQARKGTHTLDYQNINTILQNAKSHLAPRNVYKHMHRHGPENFVMPPLKGVSPREGDWAEMWWMRKLGVSNLLNAIKPKGTKQNPWQWVLRRSAWKPLSREATTKCVKQHIHSLLISRRINIPLTEYLHLLTVARDILPPTNFRNVFQKADGKLRQHFKLKLPYSLPISLPLLTRDGRLKVRETCSAQIPELPVPAPFREYVQSAVTVVSTRPPIVGQILCSPPYKCGTTHIISQAAMACKCAQRDPTLPRARGHVYIRDFTQPMPTLTDVLPDTTVWNQNMKKASVPTWMHISDTVYHKLHTVLEPLQEFGIPQATITDCVNNIGDTCATQVISQVQDTDVRVQTKALSRASE